MSRSRWPVDPALLALGELAADDRATADRLLRDDPEFRDAVTAQRDLIDRMQALPDGDWPAPGEAPAAPPLDLEGALAARPPAPRRRRAATPRFGGSLVLRPGAALACALVLLLVGGAAGTLLRGNDSDRPATSRSAVALRAFPGGGEPSAARASITLPGRTGGEVRLRVHGARPTPSGHVEEVWFMTDARRLVSVGTYRVGDSGNADVSFHTAADPHAYRYVDVSLEPDDGNPAHSEVSILRSAAGRG